MMEALRPLITEHPFFAGLAPKHIDVIAGLAKNVHFNAGEFIFREGDVADQFYLLRQGRVALQILVPGRRIVTVQTIHAHELLGWSWLFEPYRWHFHARTQEVTAAIAFDGVALRERCDTDHELGYDLMKRFANIAIQRLQAARMHMLDVYGGG